MYRLPSLPYSYDALEPVISSEIMHLHHDKHHKAYVDNLNKALKEYQIEASKNNLPSMICLQQVVKFNGGGHLNHSLFWKCLLPQEKYKKPSENILKYIEKDFYSFDNFCSKLIKQAASIKGSGWAFLAYENKHLEILTTLNHDIEEKPLLIIDVWEHAYYLQYKNDKKRYLEEIWKIINWEEIEKIFISYQ